MDRDFIRIGDKIISRRKIDDVVSRILELRFQGFSQQEVADRLRLDRTLISRLESIGELRKGATIAVVGFPILNKDEIRHVAEEEGADYVFLLNEGERRAFLEKRDGLKVFNEVMELVAHVRQYDVVILLVSDKRMGIIGALLDREVVPFEIGKSPIEEDKYVDPDQLRALIAGVRIK
ncbi:MAG: transcriptional regulator [Firmicutes bacterium]|nr:transcriptional regulator [Bacillota bacterium]